MMEDLDRPTTQPSTLERPPCRRRRVVGIDLWVERLRGEGHVLEMARCAASATHLCLVAALEEELDDRVGHVGEHVVLRLRFVARRNDAHVTDEAISELLARLPGTLQWSRMAKLEELDGIATFFPLPAL
ncbi:MAG: hypothetical protein M1115_00295 [Actinobacteria bacterium]|nr:hypothetical protein [Actinomycetota bacterium]